MALCTPALVYLGISVIFLIIVYIQNVGNNNLYCLGTQKCEVSNINMIFFIKMIYILFWTWLLNLICSINKTISWIIVFFPVILVFISFGIILMRGIKLESMNNL